MISRDRDELNASQAGHWKQSTPSEHRSDTCRSESEAAAVRGGRTGLPARLAFAAIRSGRRVGPAEIARLADLEPDVVAAELRQLA